MQEVTDKHIKIAYHLADQFLNSGDRSRNPRSLFYYDDVFSAALDGVYAAHRDFRVLSDGLGSFDAFCIKLARQRIHRIYRSYFLYQKRDYHKRTSLDDLGYDDDSSNPAYMDNKKPHAQSVENRQLLRVLLKNVKPRNRAIVWMRACGFLLQECADRYGITRERARQIEAKTLMQARKRARFLKIQEAS